MICGWDETGPHIFYVDSDGQRLGGPLFSVGAPMAHLPGRPFPRNPELPMADRTPTVPPIRIPKPSCRVGLNVCIRRA